MEERLKVQVDEDNCVGSRLCQLAASEVFEVDETRGISTVLVDEVEASEDVWEAIEGCPREAIIAKDAGSGQQLFP